MNNKSCVLIPKYEKIMGEKYDIISTVIFRPKKARSSKEDKYKKGLLGLVEHMLKNHPKWKVRIHYDKSIAYELDKDDIYIGFIDRLKKYPNVQLVEYCCPEFTEKDSAECLFHYGLFGTLIRFLPMFEGYGEDSNMVLVRDIDNMVTETDINTVLNSFGRGCNFHAYYLKQYKPRWYVGENPSSKKFAYLAGTVSATVKLPISIWEKFMNDLRNPLKFSKLRNTIDEVRKGTPEFNFFSFGIDEIFLNDYVDEYVRTNPNVKYCYTRVYDEISYILKKNIADKYSKELGEKFLRRVMKDEYNPGKTVEQNWELLLSRAKQKDFYNDPLGINLYEEVRHIIKKNHYLKPRHVISICETLRGLRKNNGKVLIWEDILKTI